MIISQRRNHKTQVSDDAIAVSLDAEAKCRCRQLSVGHVFGHGEVCGAFVLRGRREVDTLPIPLSRYRHELLAEATCLAFDADVNEGNRTTAGEADSSGAADGAVLILGRRASDAGPDDEFNASSAHSRDHILLR